MHSIAIEDLRPGTSLKQGLYRLNGEKLLEGGVTLCPAHMKFLRGFGESYVCAADSIEQLADAGLVEPVGADELSLGETSGITVLSRWGRRLVTPGEVIESHHLRALASGGYRPCDGGKEDARVHEATDAGAFAALPATPLIIARLDHQISKRDLRVTPAAHTIWRGARIARRRLPWPDLPELAELRQSELERVEHWFDLLHAGAPVAKAEVDEMIDQLYQRLRQHRERFTQLALLGRRREEHLSDQGYAVAVLAMATAARLSWSANDVRTVGVAGLFADVGMRLMPHRIRSGEGPLNSEDRAAVEHHPAYSAAMLENVPGLDPIIQWAVYQHHEREGGVGYPAMRRRGEICDLARVLAVADVFAAATGPRLHRSARLPYQVMEQIIRAAATGVFHKRATRALVEAAGLFPVGSFVKLCDGRFACILATNAAKLDRPVVQIVDNSGEATPEVIDLAAVANATLRVSRPILPPGQRDAHLMAPPEPAGA